MALQVKRLDLRKMTKLSCAAVLITSMPLARAHPLDDSEISAFIDSLEPEEGNSLNVGPGDGMTIYQAIRSAIGHDPALKAVDVGIAMSQARFEQATMRPNPQFDVELEGPSIAQARKNQQFSASVGQLVELGDKRTQRMKAGEADISVAKTAIRTRLVLLVCLVKARFLDVLVGQERLELARSQEKLALEMVHTVAQRAGAGVGEPMDQAKATATSALIQIERTKAERILESARRKLSLLLPEDSRDFRRADGSINRLPFIANPAILDQKLATSPTVASAEVQRLRSAAMLGIESSKHTVDITVKAGILRDWEKNDTFVVLGLSVPLPIFDRNQGNIHEAALRVEQSGFDRQATEVDLRSDVSESLQVMENARNEAAILEGNVLPETEKAYERAKKVYGRGTLGYLDVLDAQRSLFEARVHLLEARAAFHKSYIDLERLFGSGLALNSKSSQK